MKKLGEIFQKMDAQLEEGITEEELHAFMHVIDKVYYNMEKNEKERIHDSDFIKRSKRI